ncbi:MULTISPECIES: MobQ family relaxase [unclassified Acinetobacter]|uniref:MobQ family relaxase n=1 Tax=unclassified Acinetobacter TaxID=196816 RepID=UPI001F4B31EE|nr:MULTISPECIES: MobQ family relaxase [unclassified Acinetobacter]MCH7353929.1 MobA/MobL family protein [Acinetobacter sp. NIPH 2023]MCH7361264.1 MobA/MobL family protein [Acinetobacter sp. NIPH 2024]
MAIYHFSVKTISRSAGRSAVACAAYRSGEKLLDQRQGIEQDYTKKSGVEFTKIYAPENTNPELLDRNQLWNAVEKVETRKDANLAREFEIAFPHELNADQRQAMLEDLCKEIVKRHDVIVDAAIHTPHTDGGSDERNYHAHIMFTGRQIDLTTGEFAKKKNRDFNKEQSSETVSHWREYFADLTNQHLAKAGYSVTVDHRSYDDQGNGLEATQHEGSSATYLRRLGIDTEISLSNDLIKSRNAEKQQYPQIIKGLEQEILLMEKGLSDLKEEHAQAKEQDEVNQKEKELNNDRDRFSHYQDTYQKFANKYFTTANTYDAEINGLGVEKLERKVDKWLSKNDYHVLGNNVYEEENYRTKVDNIPQFFHDLNANRAEAHRLKTNKGKELKAICVEYNIPLVIRELRASAKVLEDRGEVLPPSADEKAIKEMSFIDRARHLFSSNEIHDIKNVDAVEKLIEATVQSARQDFVNRKTDDLNLKIINNLDKQRADDERNRQVRETEYKQEFAARLERERETQKNYNPTSPTKKSGNNDFEI